MSGGEKVLYSLKNLLQVGLGSGKKVPTSTLSRSSETDKHVAVTCVFALVQLETFGNHVWRHLKR